MRHHQLHARWDLRPAAAAAVAAAAVVVATSVPCAYACLLCDPIVAATSARLGVWLVTSVCAVAPQIQTQGPSLYPHKHNCNQPHPIQSAPPLCVARRASMRLSCRSVHRSSHAGRRAQIAAHAHLPHLAPNLEPDSRRSLPCTVPVPVLPARCSTSSVFSDFPLLMPARA